MSDELSVDGGRAVRAAGVRLLKNQCSHGTTISSLRLACEPLFLGRRGHPAFAGRAVAGVTIRPERAAQNRPKAAWKKKIR